MVIHRSALLSISIALSLIYTLSVIHTLAVASAQAAELPSTEQFMNILGVCGAGSGIKIEGDLDGSIRSLYQKEKTQGHASQEIIAKILELLPADQRLNAYNSYLGCVDKRLDH
jgi:hypothetical protein